MTLGHAAYTAALIADYEEREAWKKVLKHPFPKLLGGYEDVVFVDALYKFMGSIRGQPYQPLSNPGEDPNTPVSGRFYTHLTYTIAEGEESLLLPEKYAPEIKKISDDLWALGVQALEDVRYVEDGDKLIYQHCFFLPHMKPSGKPGELQRDIDGAALFLAYLLDKGWVKENEIPKNDVDEHGKPLKCAFGPVILRLAKSPEIQARIRALHQPEAAVKARDL